MMKIHMLLTICCLLIQNALVAEQILMSCVAQNSKDKIVKYGEKRGEKVNHQKCAGLWDKHSYQHGNVGVCQLKRHGRDRIDFFGRVSVPDNQTIAEACQKTHPLTAVKM